MKRFSALVSLALISFFTGVGVTYVVFNTAWVSDMANQPSLKAQEMPFTPPRGAVPVGSNVIHLAAHGEVSPERVHHRDTEDTEPHREEVNCDAPGTEHHNSPTVCIGGVQVGQAQRKAAGHDHDDSSPSSHDHHDGTSSEGDHHDDVPPSGQGHHEEAPPPSSGHHHEGASLSPQSEHEHGGHEHEHVGHEHEHGMAMEHGPEIVNPVEPTSASIRRGESLFAVYCSGCHGVRGQGGMPIAAKYPKIPKYTRSLLQQTPDSHMFSMLTSGHGPMPGYAEALSVSDRWDVINYVRSIQDEL